MKGQAELGAQAGKRLRLRIYALAGNALRGLGTGSLARTLTQLQSLTALDLSGALHHPRGLKRRACCASALQACVCALRTCFAENESGSRGLLHGTLCRQPARGGGLLSPRVGSADVDQCHLSQSEPYAAVDVAIMERASLHADVAGNWIGDASSTLTALPHAFQLSLLPLAQMASLASLDLSSNLLGFPGAALLAAALPLMAKLTSLDLGDNLFGAAGATSLAAVLPSVATLASLNLFNNRIGPAGTASLAVALPQMASLTSLVLSHNQLGAAGVEALAGVLPDSPNLAALDLSGNELQAAATAKSLAAALPLATSLTTLNLKWTELGAEEAMSLAAARPRTGQRFRILT